MATKAKRCATPSMARAEIERLMAGIAGFEDCKIAGEPERNEGGWLAKVDDPTDEYEYHWFWIADDGDMDWN